MIDLNLKIDSAFYMEEVRCDFSVSEKRKKIWAVELDLLNELLMVCKKHDIKINCFAGTLLGAVRHNGFIPWDDDIDVCLTREDYEKLLLVADSEFHAPYFFQTAINDKRYFVGYARLRNSETTGVIAWNRDARYNNGIYIDVFVMDGYTDNVQAFKQQQMDIRRIQRKIDCYNFALGNHGYKRFLKVLYGLLLRITHSYNELVLEYNAIISRYSDNAERVALITHGEEFVRKYWCRKEDLETTIEVPFEMISVPIPRNYDAILKNCYGDYWKLPPIEKRGIWHENMIEFAPEIPYKEYLSK